MKTSPNILSTISKEVTLNVTILGNYQVNTMHLQRLNDKIFVKALCRNDYGSLYSAWTGFIWEDKLPLDIQITLWNKEDLWIEAV